MRKKRVEKIIILTTILLMIKKIQKIFLLLSLSILNASAIPPWSFNEDFSSDLLNIGSRWSFMNDNEPLSSWSDYRVNAVLDGSTLTYRADDEVEQNGIIDLRKPDGYGNSVDGVNGSQFWWTSQDTLLNPSWSATFRINYNSTFTPSKTGGLLEGGFLVSLGHRGDLPSSTSPRQVFWTGFGITETGRKYFCTEMAGTGTSSDYYTDVDVNSSELFIKVEYDSSLLSFKSFYTTDINNPESSWTTPFRVESIGNFNEAWNMAGNFPYNFQKELTYGIGGYSNGTTVPEGLLTIDDFSFNMVPEPSALSLLAVGLGGLAILRRRRS